jgi:DnaK suppressor protein
LAYFKNKLIIQKMAAVEKIGKLKEKIKTLRSAQADILDRSNVQIELDTEARIQKRSSQLIQQIDSALERIENGSYGYCKITGNKIGLKRLEALPFTNISIEALEQMESRNYDN